MDMHATKHPTQNSLTIQEPIVMDLVYGCDEGGGIHWNQSELLDLWDHLPHGASKLEKSEILDYLQDVARDGAEY